MTRLAEWYRPSMIEMQSGVFVDLLDPRPETIRLGDVAFHLARTVRFNGSGVSVARHAILCAGKVRQVGGTIAEQLSALHHDDAEAYLLDVPRPLKPLLGQEYGVLTDRMDLAICKALGLPVDPAAFHGRLVKEVDDWACLAEARACLRSRGEGWRVPVRWDTDVDLGLFASAPDGDERSWLASHHWLMSHRDCRLAA